MTTWTRRTFLKRAVLGGAATAISASSWARVIGSNDDVRVAVLGLNGRGKNHLASLAKIPGVRSSSRSAIPIPQFSPAPRSRWAAT